MFGPRKTERKISTGLDVSFQERFMALHISAQWNVTWKQNRKHFWSQSEIFTSMLLVPYATMCYHATMLVWNQVTLGITLHICAQHHIACLWQQRNPTIACCCAATLQWSNRKLSVGGTPLYGTFACIQNWHHIVFLHWAEHSMFEAQHRVQDPQFQILNTASQIPNAASQILTTGSQIPNTASQIANTLAAVLLCHQLGITVRKKLQTGC